MFREILKLKEVEAKPWGIFYTLIFTVFLYGAAIVFIACVTIAGFEFEKKLYPNMDYFDFLQLITVKKGKVVDLMEISELLYFFRRSHLELS